MFINHDMVIMVYASADDNSDAFGGLIFGNTSWTNQKPAIMFKCMDIGTNTLCRVLEEPCILSYSFSLNGDKSVTVFATRSFKTSCLSTSGHRAYH